MQETRRHGQTAVEYVLIVGGVIIALIIAIIIVQGWIGQGGNVANSQISAVHSLTNKFEQTPPPSDPYPCVESCTTDSDCQGAGKCPPVRGDVTVWKCKIPGGYCFYASPVPAS